ncbi:MAG: hypothetical protein J0H98_04720 [Solirubrobacterales bacterium]|nr:hypothetical protein [Solirubrobacterales bacterium]
MLGRLFSRPTPVLLLVAPFFGEALSGSTPPLDLLLPWNLALMVGLYGCGALICRELVCRYRLGLIGLILLGAAYGVYEEGLVDRFWYSPDFWDQVEVGSYSVVGQTNLLLAVHLTIFHTAVSICSSVLIVERVFPGERERPWLGRRGLIVTGLVLGVAVPLVCGEFPWPSALALVAAACVMALLVAAAFWARRFDFAARPVGPPRRGLAWVAFAAVTIHWFVVYSLPSTGIAWPVGIPLAVAPIAVGAWFVAARATGDRYGRDALRVISGILSFFIVLDVFVGLAGRYDMVLGGLATAFALRWLWRREPQPLGSRSAS